MIQEFIDIFFEKKDKISKEISKSHPENYRDLLKKMLKVMFEDFANEWECPDFEKIHLIDDGDYQGAQIFIIPAKTYQPREYFFTNVSYGSCSGCDTLQRIKYEYNEDHEYTENPSEGQIKDYMTLCLHMIQKMNKINFNENDGEED